MVSLENLTACLQLWVPRLLPPRKNCDSEGQGWCQVSVCARVCPLEKGRAALGGKGGLKSQNLVLLACLLYHHHSLCCSREVKVFLSLFGEEGWEEARAQGLSVRHRLLAAAILRELSAPLRTPRFAAAQSGAAGSASVLGEGGHGRRPAAWPTGGGGPGDRGRDAAPRGWSTISRGTLPDLGSQHAGVGTSFAL